MKHPRLVGQLLLEHWSWVTIGQDSAGHETAWDLLVLLEYTVNACRWVDLPNKPPNIGGCAVHECITGMVSRSIAANTIGGEKLC